MVFIYKDQGEEVKELDVEETQQEELSNKESHLGENQA